ncbi:MAG: hypothetical protein ABL962_07475, partial [Fimbriimonadaceae bacterium]
MADRRTVFSNPAVLTRLQRDFVPVVLDTHEVQNGRTKTKEWFMSAITLIKPDVAKGITSQGRYVVTADGKALGYNNNRDVERVLTMMDQALVKFNASPPAAVEVTPELLAEQTSLRPVAGTTTIRSFSR